MIGSKILRHNGCSSSAQTVTVAIISSGVIRLKRGNVIVARSPSARLTIGFAWLVEEFGGQCASFAGRINELLIISIIAKLVLTGTEGMGVKPRFGLMKRWEDGGVGRSQLMANIANVAKIMVSVLNQTAITCRRKTSALNVKKSRKN